MTKLAERRAAEIVLLDDALRFMRVVWSVQHALQRTSKRMQRAMHVTGPQRLAIRVIGTLPGITSAELARVLHLHPSTISGILHRLVTRRLVTREPDVNDRRVGRLRLTVAGERLSRPSKDTVEAAVRKTLSDASPAKVRGAVDVLERLSELLLAP